MRGAGGQRLEPYMERSGRERKGYFAARPSFACGVSQQNTPPRTFFQYDTFTECDLRTLSAIYFATPGINNLESFFQS
jgi:hypothetical protein